MFQSNFLLFRQSPDTDINSYLWSLDQINSITTGESSIGDTNKQISRKSEIDFFSNQLNKFSKSQSSKNTTTKHHSITPSIQNLCKNLDDDLSKLLNDIEFSTSTDSSGVKISSEKLNDDLKNFNEYFQSNLELFCDNLCKSIRDLVENLRGNSIKSNCDMQKILLLCRFAHALPNNSFYIKTCFSNFSNQQIKSKQPLPENSPLTNILKKKQMLNEQKVCLTVIFHVIFLKLFQILKSRVLQTMKIGKNS